MKKYFELPIGFYQHDGKCLKKWPSGEVVKVKHHYVFIKHIRDRIRQFFKRDS